MAVNGLDLSSPPSARASIRDIERHLENDLFHFGQHNIAGTFWPHKRNGVLRCERFSVRQYGARDVCDDALRFECVHQALNGSCLLRH